MKVKLEVMLELGEMDVGELATAIRREVRAMDIPNPDGGVMFLEHLSVVVKEVESSKAACLRGLASGDGCELAGNYTGITQAAQD